MRRLRGVFTVGAVAGVTLVLSLGSGVLPVAVAAAPSPSPVVPVKGAALSLPAGPLATRVDRAMPERADGDFANPPGGARPPASAVGVDALSDSPAPDGGIITVGRNKLPGR